MGHSLRVNRKKLESANKNPPPREVSNQQFEYISEQREAFARRGYLIASADAKKKQLIGKFKINGVTWEQHPPLVNDHDSSSNATGIAISYGICDSLDNFGFAAIGASCEMPDFAVDVIELWWRQRLSLTCFKYRLAYQRCNL